MVAPVFSEEETLEDQDKGPITYQEVKEFDNESHCISVYDNVEKRLITLEAYGLDTMNMFRKQYPYTEFDSFFRFNAELMNPNRKEGRFHWIMERLELKPDGVGGRKLELAEKPTLAQVPRLPIYETVRKIPTGRMDLKERQRLREQMDMLNTKRDENISNKRARAKTKFLAWLSSMKLEDEKRKQLVEEKIEKEKSQRVEFQEEMLKKAAEKKAEAKRMADIRIEHADVKEERTEEAEEEELRQMRLRWKALDAEKARILAEAKAKKEARVEQERTDQAAKAQHLKEVQAKRERVWAEREQRAKVAAQEDLKRVAMLVEDDMREEERKEHAKANFLKELHDKRQVPFTKLQRQSEAHREIQERERAEIEAEEERRALPEKVKKKGTAFQQAQLKEMQEAMEAELEKQREEGKDPDAASSPTSKKAKAKGKSKKKPAKAVDKTQEDAVARAGRVVDEVEQKMRADLEEQQRRAILDVQREQKSKMKEVQRDKTESERAKARRESIRLENLKKQQSTAAREAATSQRKEEDRRAAEQKASDMAKLQRIREENIARKTAASAGP